MFSVEPIAILSDNYVWIMMDGIQTWVVDPGDAEPVIGRLNQLNRRLTGVLITHKHWDHVTGIAPLLRHFGDSIPVYGPPDPAIAQWVSHPVSEGDMINLEHRQLKVWETPGHTAQHLSFYLDSEDSLFCGDTLFAVGCGRIFDGSLEQLYASLTRISALPPRTRIYCTHEYTLANMRFALTIEPHNAALIARREHCLKLREQGLPTLPTSIAEELRTNPFLRCGEPAVRQSLKNMQQSTADDFSAFSMLRRWKDKF